MGLKKTRKGYLMWAMVAFLLVPFGFAGMLEGRGGGHPNPIYSGMLCLIMGCILLYFYFNARQ